jgi:hypothetical protein
MSALRVVAPNQPQEGASASGLGERIQQLQAEARALARQHAESLVASLRETQRIADEIARGGDAYPVGVRDLARRLSQDSAGNALTITAIAERV